jgi:N-glycosylase/DNA lyase
VDGTVTIPLKDFDELRNSTKESQELKQKLSRAAKEIEVFLSFLCTRENIQIYVDEFNNQSSRSTILIVDGRAKVQINEDS